MKTKTIIIIIFSFLLDIFAKNSSFADVVYENGLKNDGSYVGLNQTQWVAQSFTTGASTSRLSSAGFYLSRDSFTTGNVSLKLYSASGNVPGSFSGSSNTRSINSLSTGSPELFSFSSLDWSLAASTRYFLVLDGSGLSSSDPFEYPPFLRVSYGNGTGQGLSGQNSAVSIDSGATWPYTDSNLAGIVTVTAVPEPAPLVFFGLGGVGFFLIGWACRTCRTGLEAV